MDPAAAVPLAAEPPLLDPPALCAKASEEAPTSKIKITAIWFIERSSNCKRSMNCTSDSSNSAYRSPGHQCDGGSLAEIFVGRSATRWLRLYG